MLFLLWLRQFRWVVEMFLFFDIWDLSEEWLKVKYKKTDDCQVFCVESERQLCKKNMSVGIFLVQCVRK